MAIPRILFIVNSLRFGGAEKQVITLLNRLDMSRFAVGLIYLKNETDLLPQLDQSRLALGVWCAGVTRKIDRPALGRLLDYTLAEQIDLVVCTNNYSLWYGQLLRMLAIWRAGHSLSVLEVLHTTQLFSAKDKLQMTLSRPFYWASRAVVYVCENQRRHWRRRGLSWRADRVIHNGIDVGYFSDIWSDQDKQALRAQCGADDQGFVLGLCAAMRPEKAHGDLLQAVARLRAQGLPVYVCLIGDGPQRARIEAQIGQLGLAAVTHITGFLPDVRPWVAACDAVVLASHAVETFSLAALEAMALGKPMVMTEIGGASEQVESGVNGYLYPAGNIDALVQVLFKLMADGNSRAMGLAAREKVVAHFSLDVMVNHYADLLGEMSNEMRGAASGAGAASGTGGATQPGNRQQRQRQQQQEQERP
jgi:glycosyltransferase involved in cell wall biosynthesis